MINLELEKIQRMLYKQEQQKKAENRKKYPFIYNDDSNKNINNFFDFDSSASNPPSPSTSFFSDKEIKNSLIEENNENKINYEINSFIDNDKIPDLYTPLGKISGDKYNLIKKDLYLNCLSQEEEDMDYDNEKKIISKKRLRYFDIDLDLDIPDIIISKLPKSKNKKYKKLSYNNNSKSKFISPKFCYICLSKDHLTKVECPKYKRCFKCLKYGHWAKECKEIIKNVCENCNKSIHKKEDCLKNRDGIKYEDLILDMDKNNLKCAFCERKTHLICPFSTREKSILNYENNNSLKNCDNTQDFSHTLFCPFCAGNHLKKECSEINKNQKSSNLSEINYFSNLSSNFSSSNEKSIDNFDIGNSFDGNTLYNDAELNYEEKNDIDIYKYNNKNNYKNNSNNTFAKTYKEKNDKINSTFTQSNRNTQKNNNYNQNRKEERGSSNYNCQNNHYRSRSRYLNQRQNGKKPGSLYEHYLVYKNRNKNTSI